MTRNVIRFGDAYPYQHKVTECRKYDYFKTDGIDGPYFRTVYGNRPIDLKVEIARAPVAISLNRRSEIYQGYTGGILNNPDCGDELTGWALAVGYGRDNAAALDYIILKESEGAGWGENGYARIALSPGHEGKGICGILQRNYFFTRTRCLGQWCQKE